MAKPEEKSPQKPSPSDPLEHARRMPPLLAADPDIDMSEMGARLLVAVLLKEYGDVGSYSDLKAIALELKQKAPMVWGNIRKGAHMPLPKLLKMHKRPFSPSIEYQRLMQQLQQPDAPRKPVESAEHREARMLPPDVQARLADARQSRQG